MGASSTRLRSDPAPRLRGRLALDRFDAAVLGVLAVVSLVFLAALAIHGGTLTGIEGFIGADQAQYLAWIRETSDHLLIANQFDLRPDSHVYLQPALLPPALLHLLGLPLPLSYLAWKPVAIVVLFWGAWRYVRRTLAGQWDRRIALVVALFFIPPAAALGNSFGTAKDRATLDFIAGEAWTGGHLWGYPLTAIAAGLTPLIFLGAERALAGRGARAARRPMLLAAAGALAVSWTHPWQGSILLGVLALAGLWHSRLRRAELVRVGRALIPILAAGTAPLLYFAVLTRVDDSWSLGFEVYQRVELWPTGLLVLALAPLVVPALLGYRGPTADFQDRILRLWVPVGVAIYYAPFASFPFHAFTGLALPLGVLAMRGLGPAFRQAWSSASEGGPGGRAFLTALAAAFVTLLVVPGLVDRVAAVRTAVRANFEPYRFERGEREALDALERDARPGGVLATPFLGQLVPEETGRETWAGTISWTPDFGARMNAARQLMDGELPPAQARRLVRSSGARFVFADCTARANLVPRLGPLVVRARRYGCATVYELSASAQGGDVVLRGQG